MTERELREAIERTKAEIYKLKDQLESTIDSGEQRRLKARLKELRYLQLRHIDQLG